MPHDQRPDGRRPWVRPGSVDRSLGAPEEDDPYSESFVGEASEEKNKPSGWLLSATLAVSMFLIVITVAGVKSYADLRSSQARAQELRWEVERVETSVDELQVRIGLLGSSTALLERVAREELGLVAPDEVVVILP